MNREDCVADAAAYALGALEPEESVAYERHMSRCRACAREVTAMRRAAGALPLSAPQYRLPSGLRRRTFRAVRAVGAVGAVRTKSRRTTPPRLAVAVAMAAGALTVGIVFTQRPAGPSLSPAAPIAQVRIGGGHAELTVRDLPAPAPGRIYEVWLKRPNAVAAPTTALFTVGAAGTADVGVPGDLRGVNEILVTEEPAGGSRVPTGPPVIVAPTS
jgi:anti-sigma factor RsiW